MKKAQVSVGQYLLDRLRHFGVEHIFGLPGDYVIRFDKLIEEHAIRFINTTREDTAGYMADAYARVKGLGAACITYGVGLPIVNPTAQAYVQSSPVVIISGSAGKEEFLQHNSLHHLINKSSTIYRDTTQLEIFKQITVDQAVLDDPSTAAAAIDRVIDRCLYEKKPVYIEIPRDIVDQPIAIHEYLPLKPPTSDAKALKEALHEVGGLLAQAERPLLWIGHEVQNRDLAGTVLEFAEKFHIPFVSTLLGKTTIRETHPLFAGVYQGQISHPEVHKFVSASDCILSLGVMMTDVDTGFFTTKADKSQQVVATSTKVQVRHHEFPLVTFNDFIHGMASLKPAKAYSHHPKSIKLKPLLPQPGKTLTSAFLFDCLQHYIQPEHFVVTDVGDCLFGATDLILEQNSFIASAYFASLGSGVPAAIGAQIAVPKRKVIAIVGDGAFQMSALELSTAVRYQLDLVVILLNNHGFGTERPLIEGNFNNILDWNYTAIPQVLGNGFGFKTNTEEGFAHALEQSLKRPKGFSLIEADLDKLDFSPGLTRFFKALKEKI